MQSPPLTPIDTRITTPDQRSPVHSYQSHSRRRTGSFTSNHDRSPTTPGSRQRFSNASRYSAELRSPMELGHDEQEDTGRGGLGNLADELDQLDDEDDLEAEEFDEETLSGNANGDPKTVQDVIRDSGVDVSYMENKGIINQTKRGQARDDKLVATADDDRLPAGLEDAMDDVARLCANESKAEQTVPHFLKHIQDLGNQSAIESGVQRLNTSINSMASYLAKEQKGIQTLSTSFLPPFGLSSLLDIDALEEAMPLLDELIADLPMPEPGPLQDLQKLSRETDNVVQTLASLLDTLQMGKQAGNTASRHLRTTQTIVMELRRERERADDARFALSRSDAESKIRSRWAAQQCKDVVAGFDEACEVLQKDLHEMLQVSA